MHFSKQEYQNRIEAIRQRMQSQKLDGLLMFRQESMYYLTGYDTFGYCFFQCLVLTINSDPVLLTRAPDLRQAQHTSLITDIRIWIDEAGVNPASDLKQLLYQLKLQRKHVGIEWESYGLTAANGRRVEQAIGDVCQLQDASSLVSKERVIKSDAEIIFVRRAAELADNALNAAVQETRAGAFEGDVLAAMHNAIFSGGGDYPGNEFIIGSGDSALLCRYFSGRRHLQSRDQMTLEFAGVYRHYHACLMRTLLVGEVHERHQKMYEACLLAIQACMSAVRPGNDMGDVFDVHASVMDELGYRQHRMNACGYSLGTTFTPTWMDWPMFYTGNTVSIRPGMVFFLHMILMNSEDRRAMTLGQTVLVTDSGCESLHRSVLDLISRR